jgi:hypothetical protein
MFAQLFHIQYVHAMEYLQGVQIPPFFGIICLPLGILVLLKLNEGRAAAKVKMRSKNW